MISVIIPTRNRAGLLSSALDSLTRQLLAQSEFEVLVVDNGSTDNTHLCAMGFSGRLANLRYVREDRLGLHHARHRGLLESRGDILTYADDDIEALPTWLASIQEAFSIPDVMMVGGNNLPLFTETPPDWFRCLWNRSKISRGRALPSLSILELSGGVRSFNPLYVWGCNFSLRKTVLVAAGGFNPDGMPEDLRRFRGDGETPVSRYVKQAGLKCLFHPGASVYHKVTEDRMNFGYFHQRGYNQGISDSFSDLREEHFGIRNRSKVKRWWPYIFAAKIYRKLKFHLMLSPGARRAMFRFADGYVDGYRFHQDAFSTDPEVRDWVLKRSYL